MDHRNLVALIRGVLYFNWIHRTPFHRHLQDLDLYIQFSSVCRRRRTLVCFCCWHIFKTTQQNPELPKNSKITPQNLCFLNTKKQCETTTTSDDLRFGHLQDKVFGSCSWHKKKCIKTQLRWDFYVDSRWIRPLTGADPTSNPFREKRSRYIGDGRPPTFNDGILIMGI